MPGRFGTGGVAYMLRLKTFWTGHMVQRGLNEEAYCGLHLGPDNWSVPSATSLQFKVSSSRLSRGFDCAV